MTLHTTCRSHGYSSLTRAEILVFILLFHIVILRSLLMLKCWLTHLTLLSCWGSSVAVPWFKNKARPTLGCRSSSSDPSVQIPYFLAPSQLQGLENLLSVFQPNQFDNRYCLLHHRCLSSVCSWWVAGLSAALGHLVAGSTCSSRAHAVLQSFLQEIWQRTDLKQKDTLCLSSRDHNCRWLHSLIHLCLQNI